MEPIREFLAPLTDWIPPPYHGWFPVEVWWLFGLVAALSAQRTTRTSKPVPVTLDGHHGSYLELTVPATVRVARCADGYFMPWEGKPADAQHSVETPGTVEHLWILDVDGQRVVLDAIAAPEVTPAEVDELTAMVESVEFVAS